VTGFSPEFLWLAPLVAGILRLVYGLPVISGISLIARVAGA
jgi:hypothetical protein